jgi:hypothetical protein
MSTNKRVQSGSEQRATIRWIVVGLAIAAGLLAISCISTIAALNAHATPPSNYSSMVLHLGNFALSMEISETPQCSQLMIGCFTAKQRSQKSFTIWVAAKFRYRNGDFDGWRMPTLRLLRLPVP